MMAVESITAVAPASARGRNIAASSRRWRHHLVTGDASIIALLKDVDDMQANPDYSRSALNNLDANRDYEWWHRQNATITICQLGTRRKAAAAAVRQVNGTAAATRLRSRAAAEADLRNARLELACDHSGWCGRCEFAR